MAQHLNWQRRSCWSKWQPNPTHQTREIEMSEWKEMELRDYFAGQTLQRVYLDTRNPDLTAAFCYEMADAMLKARAQPPISEDI